MKPTSITLDDDLIQKIDEEKKRRNLDNTSQTIRQILREYFKKSK